MKSGSNSRLATLAHYVIARTRPHQLGATKLNKILWFIDCASYRQFGETVSGLESYTKRQFGPTPFDMPKVIDMLKASGAIREDSVPAHVGSRRQFTSLQEPDFESFSKAELDLINQVILELISLSANEISDLSHDALWEETEHEAPMKVANGAFVPRTVSADTLEWAQSEVARLKL